MAHLDITLVQRASSLDAAANRSWLLAQADRIARAGPGDADGHVVVLPEAFARDFGVAGSDLSPYAEPLDGPFVTTLVTVAAEAGATVIAGMFERGEDPGLPYNTLVVVDGDGVRATYRKIHLYDSFGHRESEVLRAGAVDPLVIDVAGLRVGLMTCYDLRFPELARALVGDHAELLVVPSAWVAGPVKLDHWHTLLRARAIENTVYVAAAAQPGPTYTGHSMVVTPRGEVAAEGGDGEQLVTGRVSRAVIDEVRAANPSLANRRF